MTMLTITDIQEYVPDVLEYGITDFTDEIAKTEQDIYRQLRIRWWPTWKSNRYDIVVRGIAVEMDAALLTVSQFTRAAVYLCMADHILPKLSKFQPEGDKFKEMMQHFTTQFEREFQLVLQDGVEYDYNDDGTVEAGERQPQYFLRLQR